MPISTKDYLDVLDHGWQKDLYAELYRMPTAVSMMFPVTDIGAPKIEGERWDTLPEAQTHGMYEEPDESTGVLKPYEDSTGMFGSKFKEEKEYDQWDRLRLLEDPTVTQYKMHELVIERTVTDYIFNGDLDTDPKGFNGLYARHVDGDFNSLCRISLASAGDSLKVLANSTNSQAFIDALDELIYRCGVRGLGKEKGAVTRAAFFMNWNTLAKFKAAVRTAGLSTYVVDFFEKEYDSYCGIPMVDVGFKQDQSTEIILNTYDPGDGGNDATRIYLARFASPTGNVKSVGSDGLGALTAGGLRRLDPYQVGATIYEHSLRWQYGIAHPGDDYCCGLLEGFKMAAS